MIMNFNYRLLILQLAISSCFYLIYSKNCAYCNSVVEQATDPEEIWKVVKNGMKESRQSMCSFLLVQRSDNSKEFSLSLEDVTSLFEQALDHMARATEFTQKIQDYLNGEELARYDESGGLTVLEISEDRKNLIEEYRRAESEEEKKGILERYYYKACAQKLGTVIAEKSMFMSVLKVEDFERSKNFNKSRKIKSLSRKQSREQ